MKIMIHFILKITISVNQRCEIVLNEQMVDENYGSLYTANKNKNFS